jgi:predicted DNA-binding protein YlxM (UPF0122 family)
MLLFEYDTYGAFLTDKQRELMELHYNDDLSLAEIAERAGITRQGAHDALKRAAEALERYEARLGLMEIRDILGRMAEQVDGKESLGGEDTARLKEALMRALEVTEGGNGL